MFCLKPGLPEVAHWERICLPVREMRIPSLGWEDPPGEGNGNATPVVLSGKCHGQRNLAGYSLWGHKELNTTEQVSTNTHTHCLKPEPMTETKAILNEHWGLAEPRGSQQRPLREGAFTLGFEGCIAL